MDPPGLQLGSGTGTDEGFLGSSRDPPISPGGAVSRVLVGSLASVCQRLMDEHDRPGLFFFAHDLAVRTEGTFRLRFSLTNIAS